MKYEGKNGTPDDKNTDILNNLFLETPTPKLDDTDEVLETPVLVIDLDALDKQTYEKAKTIAERLAYYFLDEEYIQTHQYVKSKITQEVDNIRRLLKMLAVNEKAQDTLIMSITTNSGKGTLYGSLTSLQNSMLSMQSQLNQLTGNLENIFKECKQCVRRHLNKRNMRQQLMELSLFVVLVRSLKKWRKHLAQSLLRKNK